jgi:2-dehydropantoate 2-reductase
MVAIPSRAGETLVLPAPRFLVVGAGGVGGIVAANLTEQGHDVTALTTNPHIADAIGAHGYRLRGESSPGTVSGNIIRNIADADGFFDFILLATQPPDVENAARTALGRLVGDGRVVCFQNGLSEERIADIVGADRVIGAIVAWGATMVEPGVYDRTSSGGFQIGNLDGTENERLRALGRALECIGPVVTTTNLLGARWSKLAINCAISSLGTVGGDRLGVLMRHRFVRRLALELMTEATLVAKASGVRLEKVAGTLDLDWISLTEDDKKSMGSPSLLAKHALLLAVGARYRRLRSSMLSAIERGRTPAVDFLNGEVVSRGQKLGVPTPMNAAIRDEIWSIAKGKAKSSFTELRAFFDKTRSIADARASSPGGQTIEAAPLPSTPASDEPVEPIAAGPTEVAPTATSEVQDRSQTHE